MGYTRVKLNSKTEWLTSRVIGGSGASSIVGENPYKTNVAYYNELIKRRNGIKIADNISNLKAVQFGNDAESPLRYIFALLNKEKYVVIPPKTITKDGYIEMLVSDKYPYMTATLDGELIEKDTGRKGILEIKTSTILNTTSREKWRGGVPNNYFIQMLHYLMVKDDAEFVILVACLIYADDKQIINTYHFERSDFIEELNNLEKAEIEFYKKVENGVEPKLLLTL